MRPVPATRLRWFVVPLALACTTVAAACAAAAGTAPPDSNTATRAPGAARVSYLAGASVYVDAGHLQGLGDGDTVRVLRDGRTIALLRVTVASTHRSACDTLAVSAPLAVGDAARFVPRAAIPPSPVPLAAAPAPLPTADSSRAVAAAAPAARPRRPRLRGNAGFSHAVSTVAGGATVHQPAFHLRLDSSGLPFDVALDLRARRTIAVVDSGVTDDASLTRLYRGAITMRGAGNRVQLSVGRQTAAALAAVSTFDGALARWSQGPVAFGAFAGTQPDAATWGFSSGVTEYGGFVDWQPRPREGRRAALTAGAVTSYDQGHPNRDFAFAQAVAQTPRWFVVASQELDFNRAWKQALGADAATMSSGYVLARYTPVTLVTVSGGYDGRRTVRLWRDRVTPETEFDDRYRQGAWLGTSVEPLRWLRVSADGRYRTGDGDDAFTWNGGLELRRLARAVSGVRLRASLFDSDRSASRLLAGSLGLEPWNGAHLEAGGGARATRDPFVGLTQHATWESVDADVALGGRWFALASWDHEHGDAPSVQRILVGLQRSW